MITSGYFSTISAELHLLILTLSTSACEKIPVRSQQYRHESNIHGHSSSVSNVDFEQVFSDMTDYIYIYHFCIVRKLQIRET